MKYPALTSHIANELQRLCPQMAGSETVAVRLVESLAEILPSSTASLPGTWYIRNMNHSEVTVFGLLPTCDICETVPARYDGATVLGPWAFMCPDCFVAEGVGLGLGRGQRLIQHVSPAEANAKIHALQQEIFGKGA